MVVFVYVRACKKCVYWHCGYLTGTGQKDKSHYIFHDIEHSPTKKSQGRCWTCHLYFSWYWTFAFIHSTNWWNQRNLNFILSLHGISKTWLRSSTISTYIYIYIYIQYSTYMDGFTCQLPHYFWHSFHFLNLILKCVLFRFILKINCCVNIHSTP